MTANSDNIKEKKAWKKKVVSNPFLSIKKGVTAFFLHQNFNKSELEEYLKSQGLKHTGSKRELIHEILKHVDPNNETEPVPITGVKKKKRKTKEPHQSPPLTNIKKGVTAFYLHQNYNHTDLVEYLKQEGLPTAGKKAALIKRIIQHIDPHGEIPQVPMGGDKKDRKKRRLTM